MVLFGTIVLTETGKDPFGGQGDLGKEGMNNPYPANNGIAYLDEHRRR